MNSNIAILQLYGVYTEQDKFTSLQAHLELATDAAASLASLPQKSRYPPSKMV